MWSKNSDWHVCVTGALSARWSSHSGTSCCRTKRLSQHPANPDKPRHRLPRDTRRLSTWLLHHLHPNIALLKWGGHPQCQLPSQQPASGCKSLLNVAYCWCFTLLFSHQFTPPPPTHFYFFIFLNVFSSWVIPEQIWLPHLGNAMEKARAALPCSSVCCGVVFSGHDATWQILWLLQASRPWFWPV